MPSPQPPNRIQTSTVGMLTFLLKLISLSHRRCPPGVYEDSTPGLRTNLFKLVYAVFKSTKRCVEYKSVPSLSEKVAMTVHHPQSGLIPTSRSVQDATAGVAENPFKSF